MNIAITVIAYNRVESLARLLASLLRAHYDANSVPLFISVDKSNTDAVAQYADAFVWPHGVKKVVKQVTNLGLRKHVLSQGALLANYDALVVLEDDLVVAPYFWNFTQQTVRKYANDDRVAGISLYSFAVNNQTRHPFLPMRDGHDIYFMNCAMSWGQVWLKRQWQAFEKWYAQHLEFPDLPHLPQSICSWDERSWLKYHTRYCIENNKFFVYPYTSYTTNFADVGIHSDTLCNLYQVPLQQGVIPALRLPDLEQACTRYDGFFENKQLYSALGYKEEECCLDLQGENGNRTHKRYWLTTRRLPYKCCQSYGYFYRPIEQNVLLRLPGEGIYLYDTTERVKRKPVHQPVLLATHFITNAFLFVREYGFKYLWYDFLELVKYKLRSVL